MSETWIYEDELINVESFQLKAFMNKTLKSKNDQQERKASGVAIYRNLNSVADCTPIHFTVHNTRRLQDTGTGDICMTDITINGQSRCILSSVHIHPGVDASHLKMFLFSALIKYSETSLLIDEECHIDKDVPIIVMGDFNADIKRNEKAFGFMKKHFDLNMVPTNYPSTLGNSYQLFIQLLQET
ncbi:hypothetical protein AVEN_173786-1 [Araneus ventricosus]|uniref:Endonuclease/exonuclease/phosphatase domain-containing protein n=1 Tax=Araneus ventricosus TaxID=182803 RepID=A0A4Y2VSU9_ARAVE|nr:hypothetical protein AVEN_1721-1 [Araneus ventricosus]GBO27771.1 hypothetical protein AVEN_189375-1 [Araneus ventricosus]GBO28749.1 hypothetical protein AVEN_169003-1 [Araneus ventricosus]GBO28752.1 hypothetical protein AVEN_173786-1 [Araneus ventricosus]